MEQEQINQIVETIKTLNLNIDSNSAIEIVRTIIPYFYWNLVKDFAISIIGIIGGVLAVYFVSKAVKSYYDRKE